MNFFQSVNGLMFGGAMAAIFGALAKMTTPIPERPLTLWLFVGLFVLLRLKIFLDDHKYFETAETRNIHFKLGLVVGFSSWVLWTLSGSYATSLHDAYFFAGIAVTISTLWIAVVAFRKGAYREQYIWIGTNSLLVMALWIAHRHGTPEDNWLVRIALSGALLLVAIDFVASKSVPELER